MTALHNDYTAGRVTLQRLANGGQYTFAYTTDASGNVVATDITDPRHTVIGLRTPSHRSPTP